MAAVTVMKRGMREAIQYDGFISSKKAREQAMLKRNL
jgi:hypothetical protein